LNETTSESDILNILSKYGIQIKRAAQDKAPSSQHPVSITLWGTGNPYREFLHVDDVADLIKDIVGFHGQFDWDDSKPDGTLRKLLDISKVKKLGWLNKIGLNEELNMVYDNYSS
jgi:GDP-L-fucose synthase